MKKNDSVTRQAYITVAGKANHLVYPLSVGCWRHLIHRGCCYFWRFWGSVPEMLFPGRTRYQNLFGNTRGIRPVSWIPDTNNCLNEESENKSLSLPYIVPGLFLRSRYQSLFNREILLGISPLMLFPPRPNNRSSLIFPMSWGKRPEIPLPFMGQAMKFCSFLSLVKSSGIYPPTEEAVNPTESRLVIFPKRKSSRRPCRFGFPTTHRENKFLIFQMVEGREPSKLL